MELIDTITTDAIGEAKLNHLVYGQYHVLESSVPFPYVINPDKMMQSFFVSEEGRVYELVYENMTTSIEVTKINKETGEPIPGTVFNILDNNKEILETVKTDKNGMAKVEGYDFGKYYVEEVEVPFPYVISPDKKIQELVLNEGNSRLEVVFNNQKAKGQIFINKADSKISLPIQDVSYGIYDITELINDNMEEVTYEVLRGLLPYEVGLTDTNGHLVFKGLDIERKWAFIELEAPYGYVVDEGVKFIELDYVDSFTPIINQEYSFVNERLKVTIKGVKIDSAIKSQIISQHFDLVLKDKDGNIIPLDHKDEDGVHCWVVDALEMYYLSEVKAPQGYELSDEIIEIDTSKEVDGNIYVIEYFND